jgi:hypothetical protein
MVLIELADGVTADEVTGQDRKLNSAALTNA